MCLYCKLFPDEVKPQSDMIDSLLYSLESRLKQPLTKPILQWKRKEVKGVGDNDGYYEVTITN